MEFIIILIFYAYIIFKDLIPMFKNKSKKKLLSILLWLLLV